MNLLLSPWTWVAIAFAALGVFAAVQTGRLASEKAEFAQFRADTARLGAEAKVKAAQEAARQAQHAQEALDDLQIRNAALRSRYDRLRAGAGGSGMPVLSSAAASLGSCPGQPSQPDPVARFLERIEAGAIPILKAGDTEIGKLVELYGLDMKNAGH